MNSVLDEGVKLAVWLLTKNREFHPFGIAKTTEGETTHIQRHPSEACPPSAEIADAIALSLRQGAKERRYQTAAVVSDVRLHDLGSGLTKDAIRVDLEDDEQHAVTCYVPYEKNDGVITMGEIVAESASPTIFL